MKKTRDSNLTAEIVKELLAYETWSGRLFWKARERKWFKKDSEHSRWNRRYAAREAGNYTDKGYRMLRVFKQTYLSHRLIWFMFNGYWPDEIDHINHVRDDNRLGNLRNASALENASNASLRKDNTTGTVGVNWHKKNSMWTACISHRKRQIHLGCFREKSDAIAARQVANDKYGYHPNHGKSPDLNLELSSPNED